VVLLTVTTVATLRTPVTERLVVAVLVQLEVTGPLRLLVTVVQEPHRPLQVAA
jgi:hypothetical protein